MKLEPETPLGNLLTAIPSASHALQRFGIPQEGNEGKKLGDLCREHGIAFDEFLRAMDELDWEEEAR